MKVSAVLACSLPGSFLDAKCSGNGPQREPKSFKIALEKLPPETIVFLIDLGSETAPKSIPLGFFSGPLFGPGGPWAPKRPKIGPRAFCFYTFSCISSVFHRFQRSLRKSTQAFATYFHVCSVCFPNCFNVFVLFPRVPCGNLRKFCLGCCWCFARFFLQRCLTCRTSPAALFGSGLPPQVKETGGVPPAQISEKVFSRFFADRVADLILERFWCQKGLPKRYKNRKKNVPEIASFPGCPFWFRV